MQKSKKKFLTEERIEKLIRFWAAGAIFYYIGWGTSLGQNSTLDLLFVLAIGTFLAEIIAVDPIVRLALNVQSTKRTLEEKLFSRVSRRIIHFMRNLLIITLIYFSYNIINVLGIVLFNLAEETVLLPAEPIMFGIFYVAFYYLIRNIVSNFKNKAIYKKNAIENGN